MSKFVRQNQSFLNYRPSHIIERVAKENGVSFPEAEGCFVECLKLLALNVLEPEALHVPSKIVDGAWHAFILHTAEYRRFCQKCLDGFVEHQPSPVTPELVAGYNDTVTQIEKYFGAADQLYWPRNATGWCKIPPTEPDPECGDCGDCHCAGYRRTGKVRPDFLQQFQRVLAAN